jgi:hypothetical protein
MAYRYSRALVDDELNVSTPSLLALPVEITLEVASYVDKYDLTALRSTCKQLDSLLLSTVGKRCFNRSYVIPTVPALDILIQISKSERIRPYIKELHICCSIHQSRERIPNITNLTRMRELHELPFRDPNTPEQEAVNKAVTLVQKGGFEKQLVKALRYLKPTRVQVHSYRGLHRSVEALRLGRSQFIEQTGRDPFEEVTENHCRAWDYSDLCGNGTMDLATHMTSIVLSAIGETLSPVSSLEVPIIQVDKLRVTKTLGAKLTHLRHLTLTITLGARRHRNAPPLDLLAMINTIPNLHTLDLSTSPHKRLHHSSLPLYYFLEHLESLAVETLHLSYLCGASPLLVPFLASLPRLETLSLHFTPIKVMPYQAYRDALVSLDDPLEEIPNITWREMFLSLKPVLSRPGLCTLDIKIDGYDAFELISRYERKKFTVFDEEEQRHDEQSQDEQSQDEQSQDEQSHDEQSHDEQSHDEPSQDEQSEDEQSGNEEIHQSSSKLSRTEMLDRLAEIMPHYISSVFRKWKYSEIPIY